MEGVNVLLFGTPTLASLSSLSTASLPRLQNRDDHTCWIVHVPYAKPRTFKALCSGITKILSMEYCFRVDIFLEKNVEGTVIPYSLQFVLFMFIQHDNLNRSKKRTRFLFTSLKYDVNLLYIFVFVQMTSHILPMNL